MTGSCVVTILGFVQCQPVDNAYTEDMRCRQPKHSTTVLSVAWAKLRDWASVAGRGRLLLSGSVAHASLKTAVYDKDPIAPFCNIELLNSELGAPSSPPLLSNCNPPCEHHSRLTCQSSKTSLIIGLRALGQKS